MAAISIDTEYTPENEFVYGTGYNKDVSLAYKDLGPFVEQVAKNDWLIGHNIAVDLDQLVKAGLQRDDWLQGKHIYSTDLAAKMQNETRFDYGLEELAIELIGAVGWKHETEAFSKTDCTKWPRDLLIRRCIKDSEASYQLAQVLKGKTHGPFEFTHRIAMTCHRIGLAGLVIDPHIYNNLKEEFWHQRAGLQDKLQRMMLADGIRAKDGGSPSPTNMHHVRRWVYKVLGWTPRKFSETTAEPSVNYLALKEHVGEEVADLLIAFSKCNKLYTTNLVGLEPFLEPLQTKMLFWLRTHINPLGAKTARRSSSKPNVQNWHKLMRQMVVSRYDNGFLTQADYKALEMIVMAWYAGDERLLDYFSRGAGYIGVGKEFLKRDIVKGSADYRVVKGICLGTAFNMKKKELARQLWEVADVKLNHNYEEHAKAAGILQDQFFKQFPQVKRFIEHQTHKAERDGFVKTATGRIIHVPEARDRDNPGYGHAINRAVNNPIQSLASDISGGALVDLEESLFHGTCTNHHRRLLNKEWMHNLIVNDGHDAILVDSPSWQDKTAISQIMRQVMESSKSFRKVCPAFDAPLRVDIEQGTNWAFK